MSKKPQKASEKNKKRGPTRDAFKTFLALDKKRKREHFGYVYQNDFAEDFEVHRTLLSQWKNEEGFMDEVHRRRQDWLDENLSRLYNPLIEKGEDGDVNAMRFAFELSGRHKQQAEVTHKEESLMPGSDMSNEALAGFIADQLMSRIAGLGDAVERDSFAHHLYQVLENGVQSTDDGAAEPSKESGSADQTFFGKPGEVKSIPEESVAVDEGPDGIGPEDDQVDAES